MTGSQPPLQRPSSIDGGDHDGRTGAVRLGTTTGLHARPVVRLTQRAKGFAAKIEMALSVNGPWVDAKSPVQMMRLKVPLGAELVFRTYGEDAAAALQAMLDVVHAHSSKV